MGGDGGASAAACELLQALLEDRKQRGEGAGGIEAQMQAAEGEVLRAGQESRRFGEDRGAEQALPANLKDEDEA